MDVLEVQRLKVEKCTAARLSLRLLPVWDTGQARGIGGSLTSIRDQALLLYHPSKFYGNTALWDHGVIN